MKLIKFILLILDFDWLLLNIGSILLLILLKIISLQLDLD